MEMINAEIFTLTYGSVVRQLIIDYEDVEEVNKQLEKMGYNIGIRLIDEFLAKSRTTRCVDFADACDKLAKLGFKMFLNVTAAITDWNPEKTECSLLLEDNPLTDFVELPEGCQNLTYCNVLCGVIRGALEMVKMKVQCTYVKDVLKGDDVSEIRLKLLRHEAEVCPINDAD